MESFLTLLKQMTCIQNTTSGEGTAYPSGASHPIPGFCGVRVAQFLVFCVVFVL